MKRLMMHPSVLPKPVREFRPEVSPHIEMVVHRLMAKRPEDRFQTPAELVEALTTHQLHTQANGRSSDVSLTRSPRMAPAPLPTGRAGKLREDEANGKHLRGKAAEKATHRPPLADTAAVSPASHALQLIPARHTPH